LCCYCGGGDITYDDLIVYNIDNTAFTSGPQSYDIKVEYSTDSASENTGTTVSNIFTVTMVDACYSNEITCNSLQDIDFLILDDNSSPGAVD
jgi:hypothetical protein